MNSKQRRQNQRDFYKKTQQNANARPRGADQKVNMKTQTGPSAKWPYTIGAYIAPPVIYLFIVLFVQYIAIFLHNLPADAKEFGYWTAMQPLPAIYLFGIVPLIGIIWWTRRKLYATWFNNNAMYLTDDIEEYQNDSYIRGIDHETQELDVAPDVGLGFNGHASTLMGHMMVSNKGIKKIEMPVRDKSVDGLVKRDADGNIVKKLVPMFNPELADKLFGMSQVPQSERILYDATDYDFNRKLTKKEGGGKDANGHYKRAGAFGRAEYDKLSDYINASFHPLDTDTERPAGVYFYDSRPVNTILIAITRGGKGWLPGLLGD